MLEAERSRMQTDMNIKKLENKHNFDVQRERLGNGLLFNADSLASEDSYDNEPGPAEPDTERINSKGK